MSQLNYVHVLISMKYGVVASGRPVGCWATHPAGMGQGFWTDTWVGCEHGPIEKDVGFYFGPDRRNPA
jgi:hypothetical protein